MAAKTSGATKPKRKATPEEAIVMDKLARAIEPDAWAEYDAGNGRCSNEAGWDCMSSIKQAQRLMRAFPAIVPAVLSA